MSRGLDRHHTDKQASIIYPTIQRGGKGGMEESIKGEFPQEGPNRKVQPICSLWLSTEARAREAVS